MLAVPSFSLAKNLCKSECEPNYEIITDDLSYPWGLAFLDETRIVVSERSGSLKMIFVSKTVCDFLRQQFYNFEGVYLWAYICWRVSVKLGARIFFTI